MSWLTVGLDVERQLDDISDIWAVARVTGIQEGNELVAIEYLDGTVEDDVPFDELRLPSCSPRPAVAGEVDGGGERSECFNASAVSKAGKGMRQQRILESSEQEPYVVPPEAAKAAREAEVERPPKCTDEGVLVHEAAPVNRNGENMCGAFVWTAGTALSKYFVWRARHTTENWSKARVLELGAGPGLVGLQLGLLGARVLLTDGEPDVLNLLRRNIAANCLTERVRVHRLWFGDVSTYVPPRNYNMIVAADVLYEAGHDSILAHALDKHMLPGSDTEAYLAYEHRPWGAPVHAFFTRMLASGFRIERLVDGRGAASACPEGESPRLYDDSVFVDLEWALLGSVGCPKFSPKNKDKVQIFRIVRPSPQLQDIETIATSGTLNVKSGEAS